MSSVRSHGENDNLTALADGEVAQPMLEAGMTASGPTSQVAEQEPFKGLLFAHTLTFS